MRNGKNQFRDQNLFPDISKLYKKSDSFRLSLSRLKFLEQLVPNLFIDYLFLSTTWSMVNLLWGKIYWSFVVFFFFSIKFFYLKRYSIKRISHFSIFNFIFHHDLIIGFKRKNRTKELSEPWLNLLWREERKKQSWNVIKRSEKSTEKMEMERRKTSRDSA